MLQFYPPTAYAALIAAERKLALKRAGHRALLTEAAKPPQSADARGGATRTVGIAGRSPTRSAGAPQE